MAEGKVPHFGAAGRGEETESIDLNSLFTQDVTSSGSFDLSGAGPESFAKLLHSLPIAALLVDVTHTVVFANEACGRYDAQAFAPEQRRFSEIFSDAADAEAARTMLDEAFIRRKSGTMEARVTFGGEIVLGRLHFRSLRAGSLRSVLVLVEDLTHERRQLELVRRHQSELEDAHRELEMRTAELMRSNKELRTENAERRRAERALHDSERRFRALLETAKDIIWAVDLDLKFTYVSPSITSVLGYDSSDIARRDPMSLLTPASRKKLTAALAEELALERPAPRSRFVSRTEEVEQYHADGSVRWIEVTTTFLRNEDNEPIGILGISRDITKRKESEKELEQALKAAKRLHVEAEAANRAKSDFPAMMSHELRTPLNAVIGFSEILEDRTFGPLNERQLRSVRHILGGGRHLLGLINDMLDLSKVETGKMEAHRSWMNLGEALAQSVAAIRRKVEVESPAISLEIPSDDELRIYADEVKIKQIMFNLLSNATKFTPPSGTIHVYAVKDGDCVSVSVRDTGSGIRREDQERIFEAFEQVDSSYARRGQGTGLGLALTKKLVELHGGRIEVASEGEGKGSVFTFTLPIEAPDARGPG